MKVRSIASGLACAGLIFAANAAAEEDKTSSYFSVLGGYAMMDEDRTPMEAGDDQ